MLLNKKVASESHGKADGELYCAKCDYRCSKPWLFKQHRATKKHKQAPGEHIMLKCECGKQYRHVQSYKRHAKSCPFVITQTTYPPDSTKAGMAASDVHAVAPAQTAAPTSDSEKSELRNIISTLMSQNQTILQENRNMQSMMREMLPKIGSNNTTFNLQVFLNEECKDAINLSDFVDGLKLDAGDLDKTRRLGYAGGVASILVRGLKDMEVHRRPIHCSDLHRQTLYVRDSNAWEKGEHGRGRLKKAISDVAKRQTGHIKKGEAENPDWNKSDEGTQQYIEMVRGVTDPGDEVCAESEIISSIAKEVALSGAGDPVAGPKA